VPSPRRSSTLTDWWSSERRLFLLYGMISV
jgi:hypothetical protein